MSQFARPDRDVAFSLLGATPTNTAGSRYTNIDESTPSSTDYVYSQNNPGGSGTAEFGLSSITDPGVDTGHILRIGCFQIDEDSGTHPMGANTGGTATSLSWELRQGSTPIATGAISPSTVQVNSINLSSGDVANISDYADLRVFVNPTGGGGSPSSRRGVAIYYIELEAPDASAGTTYPNGISGTLSFTAAHVRRISRALSASLGLSGAITRSTARSLVATFGPTGVLSRSTSRNHSADLDFTTTFSTNRPADPPPVPALMVVHIRKE